MLVSVAELPLLAQFLRARREQLTPVDVGLKASGRRRTPGLRREELATIAGVSIDYLVRLEQGRDTNPSPAVLAALGEALQLTPAERHHLANLAVQTNNGGFCPGGSVAEPAVRGTVRRLLEQLEPSPACVLGPYGDLLAWNPSWERIARPMGLLDDEVPNLARFVFTSPAAPSTYLDWSAAADAQTTLLRGAAIRWRDDERYKALVSELEADPEFAQRWSSHQVDEEQAGTQRLRHPDHGTIAIDFESLALDNATGQRVLVWLPADESTAAAFDHGTHLPVSPAQLRVVGEP
jgi:transcriptional regulator with XRE-family HTH domain